MYEHFYKESTSYEWGDHLIRDRAGAVNDVLPFVRSCNAFNDKGKERLHSLSDMLASKASVDALLNAAEVMV